MKKIIALAAAILMPVLMSAQAQINTKKTKIEDFTEKTVKVVLTGNIFFDQSFKDEVQNRWRISPFEFCTLKEFEQIKTDGSYYFLMAVKGQFRKESRPGLTMLSVMKGGAEAEKGISKMLDVVTVPVMSTDDPSGREFVFLPALLDIMQEHILRSMETDVAGYSGLSDSNSNIGQAAKKKIVIAMDDLAEDIPEDVLKALEKDGIYAADTDTADEMMMEHAPETAVGYTVYPSDEASGSFCYKMLIDAQTHKLYYFRKHRLSKKFGPGFLLEDLYRIAAR